MATAPLVEMETAPSAVRAAMALTPRPLDIFRLWANAETCFPAGMAYFDAIRTQQQLDHRSRELVILAVARLDGGNYEWVQHVIPALNRGCSAEQIAALQAADFRSDVFGARDRALLDLVWHVVRDVKPPQAVLDAAKMHYPTRELVEIMVTIGFYMGMCRLTETFRLEIDGRPETLSPNFEPLR